MNYTLLPPIVQSDIGGVFFGGAKGSTQTHIIRIKLSLKREEMRFMKKYIDNVKPE